MIEVKGLEHQYANQEKAIQYPDFECPAGQGLLLIGPSGCGKSTLLHILGGFLKPSRGDVVLKSRHFHAMTAKERNHFRQQNIGMVFQRHHFIQSLNVLENLKYTAFFSQANIEEGNLLGLLDFLEIKDLQNQAVDTLSEGQKQRLSVARALVHRPAILLADEPTSSLDDRNCDLVASLLKKTQKEFNSTLVIVSHDHRLLPYFAHKKELDA